MKFIDLLPGLFLGPSDQRDSGLDLIHLCTHMLSLCTLILHLRSKSLVEDLKLLQLNVQGAFSLIL
jgi:hypothetical protein